MNDGIEVRHDKEFKGRFKPLKQEDFSLRILVDLGLKEVAGGRKNERYVIAECPVCKKGFEVRAADVKRGHTTKCKSCAITITNTTHGGSKTRLFRIWQVMRNRCFCHNTTQYQDYGGRGITVCDEWKTSFEAFRDWALANGCSDELSIDRIDVDGNYEPDNCRWVDRSVQSSNTRRISKTNTSGYRGVIKIKDYLLYRARIGVKRKRIHLGGFPTALEAAKAYDTFVVLNSLEHTTNGVLSDEEISYLKQVGENIRASGECTGLIKRVPLPKQ